MTADQACRRIESSLERQTRFRVSATGSDLAEITPASILFNPTSPRAINNGNERWKHTHTPERRRKSARVIARLIYAKSRDVRQYQFSAAVQRFSPHVRARARARRPPPSLSSVSLPRIYGRAINTARRGKRGYRGGGGRGGPEEESSGLPRYSRAIFDTRRASKRSLKAVTRLVNSKRPSNDNDREIVRQRSTFRSRRLPRSRLRDVTRVAKPRVSTRSSKYRVCRQVTSLAAGKEEKQVSWRVYVSCARARGKAP